MPNASRFDQACICPESQIVKAFSTGSSQDTTKNIRIQMCEDRIICPISNTIVVEP